MTRKMLIDAAHKEETRVTIVSENKLEEFDFETTAKKQLKGNIYLARVVRVEPSLQAAFVEYKEGRHGFLSFSEIHPDYYQIPAEDREIEYVVEEEEEEEIDLEENPEIEEVGGDDVETDRENTRHPRLKRQYKIQEVIKKRQIMLIQISKEERNNKGAAVTTYLSLAGRYCVLMPNTIQKGGVSRRISNQNDRKRLKKILSEIKKPDSMSIIIRTAGAERTKLELKRDYEYTFRLWNKIRDLTMNSIAPTLIYEEASLIRRAVRDMYHKDVEEVIVAGNYGYKDAKAYMKELTPSHTKKVKLYKEENTVPLFQRYQVEKQLTHIYDTTVILKSGGSIVLNQTEALVSIDVNSGRSTKERSIDNTALKTNLEAAQEIAHQLRLRDMAGLIVIDFIDMEDKKSNVQVERTLKESLLKDRARIQIGHISQFGLLEMSRQRLRPSLIEATSSVCPTCAGSGSIPSTQVSAMMIIRILEEEAMRKQSTSITLTVPTNVGFYVLNEKRSVLNDMEKKFQIKITIAISNLLVSPAYKITRDGANEETGKETTPFANKTDSARKISPASSNRKGKNTQAKGKSKAQKSPVEKGEKAVGNTKRKTETPKTSARKASTTKKYAQKEKNIQPASDDGKIAKTENTQEGMMTGKNIEKKTHRQRGKRTQKTPGDKNNTLSEDTQKNIGAKQEIEKEGKGIQKNPREGNKPSPENNQKDTIGEEKEPKKSGWWNF